MNYQTLIYFKTVAELQHYTKAAAKLYITQPALSKAIQGLEEELGAPLFKRDGRNITLTKYGELLYPYAKRAIENIDDGILAFNKLLNEDTSNVFISCLYCVYSFFLPEKILHFRKLYSKCKFSIEYKFTTAILMDVLDGHSELGISSSFCPEDFFGNKTIADSLEWKPLYNEPICFIAGKNHPLAKKKKIDPAELCDIPFIPYHKSKLGTNKVIYDICAKYGKTPKMAAEGYSDIGVFNLVAMNEGIAIVPASGYFHSDQVVRLNIDTDIPMTRVINLVWSKNRPLSKLATKFRNLLLQQT